MRIIKSLFVWLTYASIIRFNWGCLEEQRAALLQIKDSINSPVGSAFSSWHDEDCCQWEAVECDPSNSTVIKLFFYYKRDKSIPENWYPNATSFAQLKDLQELHLDGNQIGGFTSPSALQNLKHLQKLNLQRNSIQEASHLCLGKMQSLHILNLATNKLQGEIPRCLCEFHSFTKLDLSHNLLQGDIGACFSNMSSIRYLDISNNHFNGSFPSLLLHNITNIETLIASHNQFTDNISFSMFANLSKLSNLDLSFNDHLEVETESPAWFPSFNLTGLFLGGCNLNKYSGCKIPSFISTQYNLIFLDLSYNSLAGSIPSWLLYNGTSMLQLRGNKLSGSFPLPNGNMSSNLTVLDISVNLFHGPIPSNLNIIFPKLHHLNASWNNFEGVIPPTIDMSLLHTLDLASNRFHGEIPVSIVRENRCDSPQVNQSMGIKTNAEKIKNMTSLEYLVLSNNFLQGKILPRNSSFPKLKGLSVRGNNFTEMNYRSLSTCSPLQLLDAAENSLSGDLSTQLPLLTNLKVIVLRRNHFDGRIPEHLCQMQGLKVLDIAENNLSDIIPLCLNNVTSWKENIYSSDAEGIQVPISMKLVIKGDEYQFQYVGVMARYLTHIDVSSNQLTGTIPFQMGDLGNILVLNVSNNLLTGHIPSSLGNLSQLESLDLSHNKFFGQMPRELADLSFLSHFSVAFNNISGQIPRGNQLGTFGNDSYEGNPGLCGFPISKGCSPNAPAATYNDGASREAYSFIFWCLVLHIM
ncbi:unnamed protein product [Camellia sinensis]